MIYSDMMDDYSDALYDIGLQDKRVVVIDCDLGSASGTKKFMDSFPDRYLNVGIAEQNAVGIAAGLSQTGFIPIVHSFAVFASLRCCEQIRNSVCYTKANVKIVGTRGGISNSLLGATHHCIEDLSVMSSIPDMVVMAPCDANEVKSSLKSAVEFYGPAYIRIDRVKAPSVTKNKNTIGKAELIKEGQELTLIATGDQLENCLSAAQYLEGRGISPRILTLPCIKPMDTKLILKCARETGAIVVAETQNIVNGVGSQICRIVCAEKPIPVSIVGIRDCFTQTGDYYKLQEQYFINSKQIIEASLSVLRKKSCQI